MRAWWAKRTSNQRLALLALALGALATAATPYRGGRAVVDAGVLAREVAAGGHRVAPLDLADRIIRGTGDARLIDLRSEAEFARYHIPTAENVPMDRLADAGIGRDEQVVLYAGTEMEAAQAWMVLRSEGRLGVSVLAGGLSAWKQQVLSPVLPDDPAADPAKVARLKAVCAYFGGTPRTGGAAESLAAAEPPPAPVVAPPAPKAGGKPKAAKKKEGC